MFQITKNKFTKVQDYFLYLLAKTDYSEKILRQKAKLKNYPESEVLESIKWLQSKNYLNEERLALNILSKYPTCGGQFWQQKMQMAGIKPEIIKKTLENTQETDQELLKKQLETKFRIQNWNLEIGTKQKIVRFMASKGVQGSFGLLQKWKTEDLK